MRSKGFFYNLTGFFFEYFCDSRRILTTFAKFCLNSLFATWSYRYLNPKQASLHLLTQQNFTNPSPCSQLFFCAYEVVQSPHENNMSGANTRSVLAKFGDNNWEKGKDFVKTFYVKNLVLEMEGSLSARALDDVLNGTIMLRKANWDKTLQKSLKFSDCRKSIRKQIRPSCRKNISTSFCVCLISWKQRNLEIPANIPK